MKNIFITEVLSQEDLTIFSAEISLKELVEYIQEHTEVQQVYLVDDKGQLEGVLANRQILEFLSPHYFLIDRSHMGSLRGILETVRAADLLEENCPYITLDHCLPETLEKLLISGRNALPVLNDDREPIGEVALNALLGALSINKKETHYAIS